MNADDIRAAFRGKRYEPTAKPGRKHYHVFQGHLGCLPDSSDIYFSKADAVNSVRDILAERRGEMNETWPSIDGVRGKEGGTLNIDDPHRTDTIELVPCTEPDCMLDEVS